MGRTGTIQTVSRQDATVRTAARAWRQLTGGGRGRDDSRRTLLACSGGADSSALVLALAAAVSKPADLFVVGHIVHDLRPRAEALADRDAARELASRLDLPFIDCEVTVAATADEPGAGSGAPRRSGGRGRGDANLEARARRLRYAALAQIACGHDCPYIATAHHAQDQLETLLMALVRGSGPRGLGGIAPTRRVAPFECEDPSGGLREPLRVIRPLLDVEREALRRLCRQAGWKWREDATNADTTRLRAAVRQAVVPPLEQLRPGAARRAVRSAAILADAWQLMAERIQTVLDSGRPDAQVAPLPRAVNGVAPLSRAVNGVAPLSRAVDGVAPLPRAVNGVAPLSRAVNGVAPLSKAAAPAPAFSWDRAHLRTQPAAITGGVLQAAAAELAGGAGRDRIGSARLAPAIRAIRGDDTDPRRFQLHGITLTVTARQVTLEPSRPLTASPP